MTGVLLGVDGHSPSDSQLAPASFIMQRLENVWVFCGNCPQTGAYSRVQMPACAWAEMKSNEVRSKRGNINSVLKGGK